MRSIVLFAFSAAFVLLAAGWAWAQTAPRLPTLAVAVAVQDEAARKDESLDDLLTVELSHQSVLQIVDRQKMQDVLKEHAIALGNTGNTKNAVALGKFVGADYLLHVQLGREAAAIRLVEVAGGQVRLEGEVALRDDLTLTAAAVREKVLAAVRPESQAVNRLTVGIAAFPNRSGTDRSDKLGLDLQQALRKRLQERPWAVVLERQYPTALLEEVDLARLGLVRENGVERLPPADLVILGTLEDVGREYEPGKPWEVKLDLTLRLRDKSSQVERRFRCDAVESAAEEIMAKIDEFRRQPISRAAVPEKEVWRRQALYLMPRPMLKGYKNAIIPEFYGWYRNDPRHEEVIRAWENVLLLDDRDAEAMTHLGLCWIGFSRWFYNDRGISKKQRDLLTARWESASRLLERALEIEPTKERAASYLYCLRPMLDASPARAKEMARYVESRPERFSGIPESPWVKAALTKSGSTTEIEKYLHLDSVLADAAGDPNAVLISFPPGLTKNGPARQYAALLNKYADSPDPVVQFVVHRALGEMLCWVKRDPAALAHFDQAIAALEAAYAKCKSPYRDSLNNIYRLKIEACLTLNRAEEAKQTAWAGADHFLKVGRFDSREHFDAASSWCYESHIGWLYEYCVTEAVEKGREKRALDLCDAYLAAAKSAWSLSTPWPRISARREELLARLDGRQPPNMSGLKVVATWDHDLMTGIGRGCLPMAVLNDALWFAPADGEPLCRFDGNRIERITFVNSTSGIASFRGTIFCGAHDGLLKLDASGNERKRYNRRDAALPGSVGEVCAGDGKIFFGFTGTPRNGVAALDPATGKVNVLAPSNDEATTATEPVGDWVSFLMWDATSRRLYAQTHFHRSTGSPTLTGVYCWSAKDSTWRRLPRDEAPHFVVSEGDETLLARPVGDLTEFRFAKSGEKLTARVPVPTLLGRPAWDARRIWAPTASGLYEIDRATGRITWLAYEDGNCFRSAMKANGRLYVAASRGLYYYDIPPTPAAYGNNTMVDPSGKTR